MFDDPTLTEAERDHARRQYRARDLRDRWLLRWSFGLLVGLFGYFTWMLWDAEVLWLAAITGLVAGASAWALVAWGWAAISEPGPLQAVVFKGPADQRTVRLATKVSEPRLFIGDTATVIPTYWKAAIPQGAVIRGRGAVPVENRSIGSAQHPVELVAIEQGPSIAFEQEKGLGAWPAPNHGQIIGLIPALFLAIALIGGTASHVATKYASLSGAFGAVRAIGAEPVQAADGAALAAASPTYGPVEVAGGWVLPAALVEDAPRGTKRVLITEAARARLVAERAPRAEDWSVRWETYQTALTERRAAIEAARKTAISADPLAQLRLPETLDLPALPRQPRTEPASLEPSEIVAVERTDPRGGTSFMPGAGEPVLAALSERRSFGGTVLEIDEAGPLTLHPERVVEDHRDTGLGLIAGLVALALALVFGGLLWRTWRAQRAYAAQARRAYAEAGLSI